MGGQQADSIASMWFDAINGSVSMRQSDVVDNLSRNLLLLIQRHLDMAPEFDDACRAYVQEAMAADHPGWASAGRAVWAMGLWHNGDEDSALLQLVLAELDLRDELSRPRRDPLGGPTGVNAACNNLGVVYIVMRVYELALPILRQAVAESTQNYGPHLWVQHLVDHVNLSESALRWALHLESVGRQEEALVAAEEASTVAVDLARLAQDNERQDARDLADALAIGARSVTAPATITEADRDRMHEICQGSLFGHVQTEPIALAVLARVCRLVGDADGCQQAAETARRSSQPGDHDLIGSAARELALMQGTQGPVWTYASIVATHAESARLRFVAGFRTRLNLYGLEQRLEEVSAQRSALQEQLLQAARREAELRREASHDPLTGLPNRTLLRQRMDTALQQVREGTADFAVAFVDLDRLKEINDVHGHAAGDAVLQRVAHRLAASVRGPDTVARLSGDEFVVLFAGGDRSFIRHWAEQINDIIDEPEDEPRASVSVGICLAAAGSQRSADAILQAADEQMYQSKRTGRGTTRIVEMTVD